MIILPNIYLRRKKGKEGLFLGVEWEQTSKRTKLQGIIVVYLASVLKQKRLQAWGHSTPGQL